MCYSIHERMHAYMQVCCEVFIFYFSFSFAFLIIIIFVACSFYASFLLLVRMKAGHWPFNIFFFSFPSLFLYFPYLISFRMTSENLLFFLPLFVFSLWTYYFFYFLFCLLFSIFFLVFSIDFLDYIFYFFSSVILYASLLCEFIWFIFKFIFLFFLKILIECYMF